MPRKPPSSTSIDSPDRRRLPPLLRRAWYGLNQAFRRRLADLEITPDQFTVLRTLREQEGISQRQLTSLISSDPNTVAALINRMEQAGLVERETHERDRRKNRLRPKSLGHQQYEKARGVAVDLQSEVLRVLPEREQELFLSQLERIAEACRQAADSSPRT